MRQAALVSGAVLLLSGVTCAPGRGAAADAAAPQPAARLWRYRVTAGPAAQELRVEAELPSGVPAALVVDRFAHHYLHDLELHGPRGWQKVAPSGDVWQVPECRATGCQLRYRYALGQAATEIDRFDFAALRAGLLLAPPSTWLLHPSNYAGDDRYHLDVQSADLGFVSGVSHAARFGAGYEARADTLFQAPYSGFGKFREQRVPVPSGQIQLALASEGGPLALSDTALGSAVRAAALVVSSYFGHFPVPELALLVVPGDGSRSFGMELGNGGASIVLFLGREAADVGPARDWVLVHEMFHLGFPSLPRAQLWLAEGLATYQEPLARARAGLIDEPALWREFLDGLPKGEPSAEDQGLDGTRSWGRTYWGGALFCFVADLALRSRATAPRSLDDALRGILDLGGNTSARWTVEATLAAGDRVVGGSTLRDQYASWAHTAVSVDLPVLFHRLGVRLEAGQVVFDEHAEWAAVRRALTARVPQGQSGLAAPGVPKSPL